MGQLFQGFQERRWDLHRSPPDLVDAICKRPEEQACQINVAWRRNGEFIDICGVDPSERKVGLRPIRWYRLSGVCGITISGKKFHWELAQTFIKR